MTRLPEVCRRALLAFVCFVPTAASAQTVDTSTLAGHVVVGYQGWFGCTGTDGHGGPMRWQQSGRPVIDMLPDLTDVAPADRCTLHLPGGGSADIYASDNPRIVDGHFAWMAHYGLDTAAVQRFVFNIRAPSRRHFFDRVLGEVRKAGEAHGRSFFVEYDLSGSTPAEIDLVAADWERLAAEGLTRSPAYQRVNGRPLVGFYGLGFAGRPWTPSDAKTLLGRIRAADGGAAIMLGVPAWWRTATHDASYDPTWLNIYREADVLSPWTVGRITGDAGADAFRRKVMAPDVAWARSNGIFYLPVVFPGFSWSNLHDGSKPLNKVPRRCGLFFQRQIANIAEAGATAVFIAMFDEVNEGTAIFKVMPHPDPARGAAHFVYLDADGCNLPSDFYLDLAGKAALMLRQR